MARAREPEDWERDLAGAKPTEADVAQALKRHPAVSHLADFTSETDAADFSFRFEDRDVRLELKEKKSHLTHDFTEQWREVPPSDLFVVDETSFRRLVWPEGLGYLLVHDEPERRWCTFGPWELCLGPRRRFERWGDKGGGAFLKGKLLLDLRTAAARTPNLDIEAVLAVVRSSRAAVDQVEAVKVRNEDDLPVIPKGRPRPATPWDRRPSGVASVAPGAVGPSSQASSPEDLPSSPTVMPGQAALGPDEDWAGLSVLVADQLRAWGWASPTAVQGRAIPAILAGRNVLVLGPTAGGKTEAAALPLLDRWRGGRPPSAPSILVVSPAKALLSDQLHRWRRLGGLVGATAFAWYGDVDQESRKAFKASPTDVLLTTPESLENLLSSPSTDERALFTGLRAVVVDEVHAFVGTARGGQLASLVERLDRFANDDLQRVGLSATVGNAEEVLGWVSGGSLRDAEVVDAGPPLQGEILSFRSYVDDASARQVIGAEISGHRSIVFTRSRRRAEQLAGSLGLPTYHSSIAASHRSAALERLRDGEVGAVVATSSLEMGIDVGDLDLIVHDGAPSDPASYLQRLGRAGRRTGQRRLVFTTGEPDDLLLILAVVARARRGDVGRLPPQRGARLVLGQQALALAFQHLITARAELRNTLRWSRVFRGLEPEIDATIEHLVAGGWLQETDDRLLVGREGQRRFGGGMGLVRLLATFKAHDGATVVDLQGRPVGQVDWSQVADGDSSAASQGLSLGGRSWTVLSVDRSSKRVVVEPATRGRPPSWRGPAMEVERATWEVAREVLAGTEVPLDIDDRAAVWLEATRLAWTPRLARPARATPDGVEVDTFAGVGCNRSALSLLGFEGTADGPSVEIHASADAVRARAQCVLGDFEGSLDREAERVAAGVVLANPELTAPAVLRAEARTFMIDAAGLRGVLALLVEWPS